MTLPFDIPQKNKRKYQCFVCGVMFLEYEIFRDHIIETHEEGRDYIVCPFKHCQAPVRDVRAHSKAKHPGLSLPKKGMMRATVWRDFKSNGSAKKKTRKPKFREGYYESSKMGKMIHYRSGYEEKIYECLDADINVTAFDAEPFEIPYVHKGKSHRYIPDLIVRFIDGSTEVWEIKPSQQTALEKNQNKWHAANEACHTRGWEFKVITEKGIELLRKKIKRQRLDE